MDLVVRLQQREEQVRLERTEAGYKVTIGERSYDVDVAAVSGPVLSLLIAGRQHEVAVRPRGNGKYLVSDAADVEEVELMDPLTYLARQSHGDAVGHGGEQVKAYMPGRVVKILVAEGEKIEPGQGLVVLEAMKMENEIAAESAGVVTRVLVEAGQAVEGGDPLFEIGPA